MASGLYHRAVVANRPASRARRDRSQYWLERVSVSRAIIVAWSAEGGSANSAGPKSLAAKRRAFVRGTFVRPAAALRRQPDRRGQPWHSST